MTYVYLGPPTLFNIILDAVVRATLQEICGPQEAQHGFGWSEGEHSICFYADGGRISGRDLIWVQTALTTMVRMFERVGFQTNLNKTKAMICTPGFIWGQQGAESYKRKATREGPTFRERKITRVICKDCGEKMSASYLRHHMERAHGRVLPQVRSVDVGGGGLEIYKVSFTWILKSADSPVEGLPSKETPREGKGNTLCFVIGNWRWPSFRREHNHYRGAISKGCTYMRPDSLNIGSRKSAINKRRDGSSGGMWIWRRGVGKCSST